VGHDHWLSRFGPDHSTPRLGHRLCSGATLDARTAWRQLHGKRQLTTNQHQTSRNVEPDRRIPSHFSRQPPFTRLVLDVLDLPVLPRQARAARTGILVPRPRSDTSFPAPPLRSSFLPNPCDLHPAAATPYVLSFDVIPVTRLQACGHRLFASLHRHLCNDPYSAATSRPDNSYLHRRSHSLPVVAPCFCDSLFGPDSCPTVRLPLGGLLTSLPPVSAT